MPSNPAFAFQLSLIRLACAADLLEQTQWSQLLKSCSRVFRAARRLIGRFRGPQASRFLAIFQVLFCRGPMLKLHAPFTVTFL